MASDKCPECGEPYLSVHEDVDFRPRGALFDHYIHSYKNAGGLREVDEDCYHVKEWGQEAEQ